MLETHGFERRFADIAFVERTRVVPVVHVPSGLPVDIVIAGPGLEEDFLRRAVVQTIDGVAVPIVEIADLLILKGFAGRPKDLEDVVTSCRIHRDDIDAARVRTVLAMLEGALGQSDLLAAFEQSRLRARE